VLVVAKPIGFVDLTALSSGSLSLLQDINVAHISGTTFLNLFALIV